MSDGPSNPEQKIRPTRRKILTGVGAAAAIGAAGAITAKGSSLCSKAEQREQPEPQDITFEQLQSMTDEERTSLVGKPVRIEGTAQHIKRSHSRITNYNYTTGIPVPTGDSETIIDYFLVHGQSSTTPEEKIVFAKTYNNTLSSISSDSNPPLNPYLDQRIQISGIFTSPSGSFVDNILGKDINNSPQQKPMYYINKSRVTMPIQNPAGK